MVMNFSTLLRRSGLPALLMSVSILAGLSGCGSSGGLSIDSLENTDTTVLYQIGPGDSLEIFVWRNPEISRTLPVRPDGMISMPLVEDVVAVGKTPSQLARDLEKVLSEYIKSPQVNVIVVGFVGTFADQIRVVGKAAQPMALPFRSNMTLLDVLIEVGGLAEGAAGNRAKIIRRTGGQTREIRVRLSDLLNNAKMSENIRMMPGDVLLIPESRL